MEIDAKFAIPIVISILAFVIAGVNLYLTQLRKASLVVVAGEHVHILHFKEGNCGVTMAISITNRGARTVTVRRLALLIQSSGSREGYLLEPLYYELTYRVCSEVGSEGSCT